jgi:hypothetical protein
MKTFSTHVLHYITYNEPTMNKLLEKSYGITVFVKVDLKIIKSGSKGGYSLYKTY